MDKQIWNSDEAMLADYHKRNEMRYKNKIAAIMGMVNYYMQPPFNDALEVANNKVEQISLNILQTAGYLLIGYELGNSLCTTELITVINGIDEVTYPFFDSAAKAHLISLL